MRNLAFHLSFTALLLILPIAGQASSEKVAYAENSTDFLFKYFDLDPVLKNIPRPVQYMISKELVDLFAGCFTLDEPYRTISFKGKIDAIAFNNNGGKFLVFNKKDSLFFYDTEEDILHERKPFNRERTYPKGLSIETVERVAFSPDDTKVAVLGEETIHEFEYLGDGSPQNFDFIEDELVGNTFKTYAISNAEKLLQSKIAGLSYTQDGRLMVAGKNTNIAVLNSLYTICDEQYKKPQPISERYLKRNDQFESLSVFRYHFFIHPTNCSALFARDNAKIIVFSDNAYKEIDATEGNYPLRTKVCALSLNGRFLAVITIISDLGWELLHPLETSWVYLWDIPYEKLVTIHEIPEIAKSLCFSPDSASLLIRSSRIWRIYDLKSGRCIAQSSNSYSYEDNISSFNTFNSSGTLFATATMVYEKQDPHRFTTAIQVWKRNLLWKDLTTIYSGELTIEQVLFILFVRDLSRNDFTIDKILPTLAEKYNSTTEDIKNGLQKIFSSFSASMKKYLYCLIATTVLNSSDSFEESPAL